MKIKEISSLVETLNKNRFGVICLVILTIINLIPSTLDALLALFASSGG